MLLAEDGRHVWLGRHSDPALEEIEAAEARLREMNLGGWLAIHDGDYWDREKPVNLMMVRSLASPAATWEQSRDCFEAKRREWLTP
ncbi:hypothetical protein ACVFYP_27415 [Roseomonas sp. F4]